MEIKSYSKHHIDVVVQNNTGSSWRCTGVYNNPKTAHMGVNQKAIRFVIYTLDMLWRF